MSCLEMETRIGPALSNAQGKLRWGSGEGESSGPGQGVMWEKRLLGTSYHKPRQIHHLFVFEVGFSSVPDCHQIQDPPASDQPSECWGCRCAPMPVSNSVSHSSGHTGLK